MQDVEEPTTDPDTPVRQRSRWGVIASAGAVVVLVAAVIGAAQFLPSHDDPATSQPVAIDQALPATTRPSAPGQFVPPTTGGASSVGHAAPHDRAPSEFDTWVQRTSSWLDIPARAMRAYASATLVSNKEQPDCHMSWVTLAGIGKVASDHGRVNSNSITASGVAATAIGNVEKRDFFGQVVSDASAAGPMQLPAPLWASHARSVTGAGAPNQQNIDDDAAATARALCADGRDLSDGGVWWSAVGTLDDAPLYLHQVLATATVYGTVAQSSTPPKPQALKAVDFAISKIGLPYVWGGNGVGGADHGGFDCSGLTTAAYATQEVTLPRTADTQYHATKVVPSSEEPQLGDLIFYGDPRSEIHHVGIYIGNRQMVDAPTEGQAVQVHRYRNPGDDFAGAGRVV